MKKQWIAFVAVMTAAGITACGSGDGIVINGTTAAEAESTQLGDNGSTIQETTSGTKIEIITGETTTAPETAPESTEGQTQAPVPQTQPAAQTQTTAPATQAATQPETTAAKVYKVNDVKKTMYATASVRVRASYSTSSDVLAGLAKDEKVEVTGESENGWLRVNYKGKVGYVSKDYLTETAPAAAPTQSSTSGQPSAGSGTKPTTPNPGTTTPGATSSGTTAGPAGPTASNSGATSPGSTNTTNGSTSPGGSTAPGSTSPGGSTAPGSTSPGGTANPGTTSTPSGGNSVTGSVTALDPSGVTVQTSNGTSYQFVWGDSVPALAPGEKIQIFYETTSSGQKRVTSYSK